MPANSIASVRPFSPSAGPSTSASTVTVAVAVTVPVSGPTTSPSLRKALPSPISGASHLPRYILLSLLPPRDGQTAAPSVLPSVGQETQSIRKANLLANWTSSTGPSFTTSGIVTRSLHFSSTRSTPHTVSGSSIPILDHSTPTQPVSSRPNSVESGSSHADSDCPDPPTPDRPPLISEMSNTYFPLHLSTPDSLQTLFRGPDGRLLFSTSTDGHTTVIRRMYGRSARITKQKQEGLILAEIEWMSRVRSSRIRFKGVDVDVRIDEYLKETQRGSGYSRMFATSDGRTFKWKVGCPDDSAELFECAAGRRVSGLLASSNPSTSTSSGLPTPPTTPPIILLPSSPPASSAGSSRSSPAWAQGFEVPSISLSEPETRSAGEKPTLRVHTSVLDMVDQIVVTWVIMERDRSMRKMG